MTTHTVVLRCPHVPEWTEGVDEKPAPCEADVEVDIEFTAPERGWGSDADGNRGITMPGYWSVVDVPNRCAAGHELSVAEWRELRHDAERAAADYERI